MFEELAFCDSCGNYVPTVEEDGSLLCAYEYAEYPDIATVVGQRVSGNRQSLITIKKGKLMNVTVTDNNMNTVTYGYAPEHFAGVVEFYSDLVQSGEIYTYTVKMQRVDLTYPEKSGRP